MHVLIIDDDATFRHLLAAHMRNHGLRVSVAQDGLHGQRMAREEQPDVILLDHLMPAASGLTVLERLKKFGDTAGIPVIMISGSEAPGLRREAIKSGAIGLLNKNLLTESDLVSALEDASRAVGMVEEDFSPLFPGQEAPADTSDSTDEAEASPEDSEPADDEGEPDADASADTPDDARETSSPQAIESEDPFEPQREATVHDLHQRSA